MNNVQEKQVLKNDNFLVNSEQINSSDETYSKLMFVYSAAIKQLETKIGILKDEFEFFYGNSIIDHTKSRIKKTQSIVKKMEDKSLELTYKSMVDNINDIAGIRIVCPSKEDVYNVVKSLKCMPEVTTITEKDYITSPKKSGYSSYHMIVGVPVQVFEQTIPVKVEIQIRTLAMDFWANLEHDIKYKTDEKVSKKISNDLIRYAKIINNIDSEMMNKKHGGLDGSC